MPVIAPTVKSEEWGAILIGVLVIPLIGLVLALCFILTLLLFRGAQREIALRPRQLV